MKNSNNIFNPDTTSEIISGYVCGNQEIQIEDFESIKCPICGEYMKISGLDFGGESNREKDIMRYDNYVDDYGVPHCRVLGRDRHEEKTGVHMSCPNNCVKEMLLDVKQITLGGYREFTEFRR